nr:cation transporter [uncultured Halomonas sp.]
MLLVNLRHGVSEAVLVIQDLKPESCDQRTLEDALQEIDHLYSLDSVVFDEKKRMLRLAYDALRICIECGEKILTRHSISISQGWWNRFKKDHYRFVDQNIKDNATKEPWSCH